MIGIIFVAGEMSMKTVVNPWVGVGEILLASSSERIRDVFVQNGQLRGPLYVDEEVEGKLLARGDRLVDLTLAEYCLHGDTARKLFFRDPEDWVIRTLVLSNNSMGVDQFVWGFPWVLFGSKDATNDYLSSISASENRVLFFNPTIADNFLEEFLSLGAPWVAMSPHRRLEALRFLGSNKKLLRERSTLDYVDGGAWHLAGKKFAAAYSLIEKMEPTPEAANSLSSLLRNLPIDGAGRQSLDEAALARWKCDSTGEADEVNENKLGRLSAFQAVRQAGGRLFLGRRPEDDEKFWHSEDVALRCGAYEGTHWLDAETIKSAVARDGDLARVYLVRNKGLWYTEAKRDMLWRHVLVGSETGEPRYEYDRLARYYRAKSPYLFNDERTPAPNERLVGESSIAELVSSLTRDPAIKGLQERLEGLERGLTGFVIFTSLMLVILVALAWR